MATIAYRARSDSLFARYLYCTSMLLFSLHHRTYRIPWVACCSVSSASSRSILAFSLLRHHRKTRQPSTAIPAMTALTEKARVYMGEYFLSYRYGDQICATECKLPQVGRAMHSLLPSELIVAYAAARLARGRAKVEEIQASATLYEPNIPPTIKKREK